MAKLIITVPNELDQKMKKFHIDWSGVALRAVSEKAEQLARLKEISSKIKISEADAKKFTDKISEAVARRFRAVQ